MATTTELKQQLAAGSYDAALAKLYANTPAAVAAQRARYLHAVERFEHYFGAGRSVRIYSAPGRTEIGGNHTDHNNGVVMAAAVNLDIISVVSPTEGNTVRIKSHGFDRVNTIDLSVLTPQPEEAEHSASLVRGVAAGIVAKGGKIGGFDCYSTSEVLRGSGLSSSASFEVCMAAIFRGEYNGNSQEILSQVEIAKISQYAENEFFGKPSGLMDQTASAVGSAITIDFKDPAAPLVRKVAFDLAAQGYALCISDTKGSHADLTEDYTAIRREMESVAAFFGKKVLREVDEDAFIAAIPAVRKVTGDRAVVRAIHFYDDCHRAQALCDAVEAGEFGRFLALIREGGHSSFEFNQNAYSIKNPAEQGVPLGLAISQRVLKEQGAWRLQGGGFAGTIQAFVPLAMLDAYKAAIDAVFGAGSCHVLSVRGYGAVEVTPTM
ncbi:MAG: galactokinase family protein [Gemmiger sp.]|nr:galactokinase family protein [Gemmiger sp.]